MQPASPSTQIPRIRGAAANGQSNNQETSCCQLRCFGRRTVSLSNRVAVFLSAFAIVGGSVGTLVGGVTSYALSDDPNFSEKQFIATGIIAGIGAGVIAIGIARQVYNTCRQTAISAPQVQLSRIISHAPEADAPEANVPPEIFSPGNNTTFSPCFPVLPSYSSVCPPPPYSPREALRE